MTDVLDVVGLLALIAAGFLLGLWLGFAVLGVACLLVSRGVTQRRAVSKVDRRAVVT